MIIAWHGEKVCACGCGSIIVSQKPRVRFLKGHDKRKSPVDYIVDGETGCWIWQLGRDASGYGTINRLDCQEKRAHRYFYEKRFGPIPAGMLVCHRCDNPPCVNPDHLFLGTYKDNAHDSMNKGRWPNGSQRSQAKLTESQVLEIRLIYGSGGTTQLDLARKFGVSRSLVRNIVLNKAWRQL